MSSMPTFASFNEDYNLRLYVGVSPSGDKFAAVKLTSGKDRGKGERTQYGFWTLDPLTLQESMNELVETMITEKLQPIVDEHFGK